MPNLNFKYVETSFPVKRGAVRIYKFNTLLLNNIKTGVLYFIKDICFEGDVVSAVITDDDGNSLIINQDKVDCAYYRKVYGDSYSHFSYTMGGGDGRLIYTDINLNDHLIELNEEQTIEVKNIYTIVGLNREDRTFLLKNVLKNKVKMELLRKHIRLTLVHY